MGRFTKRYKMDKMITISAKMPEDIYAELAIRIPEGERSNFIRDAIIEKLQGTPRPDKLLEMERRIQGLEEDFSTVKQSLADLELFTYERGKVNPHAFCIDKIDHEIINLLLHHKGATTPELAEALNANRWLILNRLKRIQRLSKRQLGKPIVEYYAGERSGKNKAWWLNGELTGAI